MNVRQNNIHRANLKSRFNSWSQGESYSNNLVYNNIKCYSLQNSKEAVFGHREWQYLKKINDQHTIYVGNAHLAPQAERKSIECCNTVRYCTNTVQHNPGYYQHYTVMLLAMVLVAKGDIWLLGKVCSLLTVFLLTEWKNMI